MKFSEIHGKEELKKKLAHHLRSDKVAHAQMYLGAEGSGALALAIASISLLFCESPTEDDSCGTCPSCVKINKHIHPDVHYTFPTVGTKELSTNFLEDWRGMLGETLHFNVSDWVARISKDENKTPNITREESRDIINKLSLKPFEGKAKALIIWMPEYLDKIGNSLLKILEEPPQKTYFILVAEQFDKILSTVSSRTQLVKVPSYTDEEILSFLRNKYQLEPSVASHIAYLSEGNMRSAVAHVEEVEDNHSEMFRNWMLSCHRNDLASVAQLTDEMAKTGRVQTQLFLQNSLRILREALLFRSMDNYKIRYTEEYRDFIQKFSQTMNAKMIEDSYVQINDAIYHIGRNANAKISLFNLSLSLRHNFLRKK